MRPSREVALQISLLGATQNRLWAPEGQQRPYDPTRGGGVFIAVASPSTLLLEVGTHVAAHIVFPGPYQIDIKGRVRWIREKSHDETRGFGVSFDQIAPAAAEIARRFSRDNNNNGSSGEVLIISPWTELYPNEQDICDRCEQIFLVDVGHTCLKG